MISYAYDKNGNITSITEDSETIEYVYNELNEVVRENNQRDNKSFVYNYDLGGNLLSKVQYAYSTGTLGTPVSTISYAYANANWKDLMTSFDGKAITYDAIGNPLTYDGGTFAWEGRKLTSFDKTGLAVSYTYNANGIRTSKTVNNVTTNYRLSGDKVTFEQTGSDTIYYVYDTQGQLISMILNNVEYAYVRNAQNDIVGLINNAGIQVVSYTYSTWGEVLSITGTLASTLGQQNPYRYRGYRYDSETGLYYLQSRYYNPQWGRFLNADDSTVLGIDQGNLIQYNLFAYCVNNAVNNFDPNGYSTESILMNIASLILSFMMLTNGYMLLKIIACFAVGLTSVYITVRDYNQQVKSLKSKLNKGLISRREYNIEMKNAEYWKNLGYVAAAITIVCAALNIPKFTIISKFGLDIVNALGFTRGFALSQFMIANDLALLLEK